MIKFQYFIDGFAIEIIGIVLLFYSKRLSIALRKSTEALNQALKIKRNLDRGTEIFGQIFLIVLGCIFVIAGIRIMVEMFKK